MDYLMIPDSHSLKALKEIYKTGETNPNELIRLKKAVSHGERYKPSGLGFSCHSRTAYDFKPRYSPSYRLMIEEPLTTKKGGGWSLKLLEYTLSQILSQARSEASQIVIEDHRPVVIYWNVLIDLGLYSDRKDAKRAYMKFLRALSKVEFTGMSTGYISDSGYLVRTTDRGRHITAIKPVRGGVQFELNKDCYQLFENYYELPVECFELSSMAFKLAQSVYAYLYTCFKAEWGKWEKSCREAKKAGNPQPQRPKYHYCSLDWIRISTGLRDPKGMKSVQCNFRDILIQACDEINALDLGLRVDVNQEGSGTTREQLQGGSLYLSFEISGDLDSRIYGKYQNHKTKERAQNARKHIQEREKRSRS